MTINRLPKKRGIAATLLLLPLFFTGCPNQYHYNDPVISNTLVIENHASAFGDILYAYVTPSDSSIWGNDLLGMDILQPGDQLIIDIYGCNRCYDIMIEYDNGLRIIEPDRWLPCNTTTIVPFIDY